MLFADSWCSHRRPCQLPVSPQLYWARSCVSSSSFVGSSVVILVCFELHHLSAFVYVLSTDNIAPPVASCLGDLITMTLLGVMSTLLILGSSSLGPFLTIGVVVLWAIACTYAVLRNQHVKPLLKEGWTPLLGSMVITSASGIVLDLFVSRYDGYALLAVAFGGMYRYAIRH